MPMKDYIDAEETFLTVEKSIESMKKGEIPTPRKNATEPPEPEAGQNPEPDPSPRPKV